MRSGSSSDLHFAVTATHPGDDSPSLDPAVLRVKRAADRLNELRDRLLRLRARAAEHPLQISVHRKYVESGVLDEPRISWSDDSVGFELQQDLRALSGEVVYHLRTSLEYLAYHLVWHDGGTRYEFTQFPAVPAGKASEWTKTAKRLLPGVTGANLERIRLLQPFAGCSWTAELTDLSNIDKHRSPIKIGVAAGVRLSVDDLIVAPDPNDPEWYNVRALSTLEVQTHTGQPLDLTLKRLCLAVNETLVTFTDVLPGGYQWSEH